MKKTGKKRIVCLLLVFCLLLSIPGGAFAAVSDTTVPVTIEGIRLDAYASAVLEKVNEVRAEKGLLPLTLDSDLQEIALVRAAEIAVYFDHIRPNGKSCITVSEKMAGENIAIAYPDPDAVMTGWMNSEGHRANILNASYSSIGIACVYSDGVFRWVQIFGRFTGNERFAAEGLGNRQTVDVLTGLINLKYSGETSISLNSGQASDTLQASCSSTNAQWSYGQFPLDPELLTYRSSDPTVVTIDDTGHMTPKKVGSAVLTISLKADPSRSITQEIQVDSFITPEMVKLSQTSYTYNGKARKPEVTVEGVPEENYIVSYKNNIKVGTATVVIEGIGNVTGKVEKTFQINYDRPARVTLQTPTTGTSHYVKVRWKKTDCDGYQIRYSTSKTFKSYKTVYVKDGDAVSKTIKNLTKGKRYYVKVRAYNLYEGKRVYGSLSTWRSVVCK
ncbi:MAG: CAP domain-containing protein [Anaerovoracaceae bacterium]